MASASAKKSTRAATSFSVNFLRNRRFVSNIFCISFRCTTSIFGGRGVLSAVPLKDEVSVTFKYLLEYYILRYYYNLQ